LLKVDIKAVGVHLPDQASIPIALVPLDEHLFAMNELAETLAGRIPERLFLLGSVDACEPDLVLPLSGVQNCYRVPVDDRNHLSRDRFSRSAMSSDEQQDYEPEAFSEVAVVRFSGGPADGHVLTFGGLSTFIVVGHSFARYKRVPGDGAAIEYRFVGQESEP
jgi:hypothetical protein